MNQSLTPLQNSQNNNAKQQNNLHVVQTKKQLQYSIEILGTFP